MKMKRGMPITGANTQMRPKPPVLTDAADTSRDAEKQVMQSPRPFANKTSVAQSPPGTKASGGISTMEPRIASGLTHQNPGARALPNLAAAGQRRPINQSGQVNGRMGTSFPRKVGQNGQGFPSKRNARFYGE